MWSLVVEIAVLCVVGFVLVEEQPHLAVSGVCSGLVACVVVVSVDVYVVGYQQCVVEISSPMHFAFE